MAQARRRLWNLARADLRSSGFVEGDGVGDVEISR